MDFVNSIKLKCLSAVRDKIKNNTPNPINAPNPVGIAIIFATEYFTAKITIQIELRYRSTNAPVKDENTPKNKNIIGTLHKREVTKFRIGIFVKSGIHTTTTKYVNKTASNKTKEEYLKAFMRFNPLFLFLLTKSLNTKQGTVKARQNTATAIITIHIFRASPYTNNYP